MAEMKKFNTRILNKIDTLEAWNNSTLPIKKGEICLATVAASAGNGLEEPVVMIKVGGDEEKTFSELPWSFYAKASDVLEAAKDADKLTAFVNNVIANAGIATNEALSTLSGKVTTAEGKVTTLEGKMTAVEGKAAANETAIGALEGLVGDTAVATQISNAIAELDLANTYEAKGEAAKVQSALDTYKTSNDAAVQKNATDIAGEIARAKAAEEANAGAISAIKDGTTIDSFADVEAALAGKQATGDYATKTEAQAMADGKDAAIAEAKKAGTDAMAAAEAAQADADALEALVGDTAVATQITDAITELDLANTYAAKSHTHTKSEITDFAHTHEMSEVNGLETALAGKQAVGDYATKAEAKGYADAKDAAIQAAQDAADAAQGEVDALETYVGTIPSDEKYADITSVIGFINKKAEETLAAAQGGSSETAASVKAALDTYKSENNAKVQANADAIDALEALVGEDNVAQAISDAVAAEAKLREDADKALDAKIEANADAIEILNGDDKVEGSVDYKVAQEVAKILNDNDATDIDTLEEIAAWIKNDTAGVGALNQKVTDNETAIGVLNGTGAGSVAKTVADAIAAENLSQYATDGELSDLAGRVSTVEGDLNTATTGLKARMTTAEGAIDALEELVGEDKVVDQIDAAIAPVSEKVTALEGKAHTHANAEELAKFVDGDKAKLDTAVQTVTAGAGLTATKTGTDVAIAFDESITFVFDCGGAAE